MEDRTYTEIERLKEESDCLHRCAVYWQSEAFKAQGKQREHGMDITPPVILDADVDALWSTGDLFITAMLPSNTVLVKGSKIKIQIVSC